MTKREVALGGGALFAGILVGALFFRHREPPPTVRAPEDAPDAAPPDEPLEPLGPEPDDADIVDAAPEPLQPKAVVRTHERGDAATPSPRDAASDASPIVIRASRLLIHPADNEQLCVDVPSRRRGLQLHGCHGRANQRWTFAEDTTAANRIFGEGGCIRIARARSGGEAALEMGACAPDTPRFRYREDHRFEDVQSGLCVTTRLLDKRTRLVLTTCDASSAAQTWTLAH
jgi:Ricin-type beta-trefoil lectin domain